MKRLDELMKRAESELLTLDYKGKEAKRALLNELLTAARQDLMAQIPQRIRQLLTS